MSSVGVWRQRLAPRQSGVVTFRLPASELRWLDESLQLAFEKGEVEVFVGPSADPTGLLRLTIALS